MEDFRSKYTDIQLVEKDDCSQVYVAINNETQQKVRIKVLRKESDNKRYIKSITEKINMLKDLKHENLIGINDISSFVENNYIYYYIETEYFKSRSLWNKVVFSKLTYIESLNIIKQIVEGLKEFHHKSLSHENLDIENIFINSENIVKVDVLSYLEQKYDESGKLIDEEDFYAGREEDIYSIGIILYALITRDFDFSSKKLKKNIKEEEVFSIIYGATTDKADYMYENLNDLMLDVSACLEGLPIAVEKTLDEGDSSVEEEDVEEYDSISKKRGLIKKVCACAAVILVLVMGVKGIELLNKDKKESAKNKPTTEIVKEEPVEEEPVEEDTAVEAADATDIQSNNVDTYQDDYYSNENTDNNNNINNNYNNNNNSNNNNNNTGNNNNGNNNGNDNTVIPPSNDNNEEPSNPGTDDSNTGGEETPTPNPNPDEGNEGDTGGSVPDSEINSGM
ncbi:protein kinase domain-containing protein [Terrisporobacter vanillatitrophus]|uniref:protein kinase domain-containing protein n=1 Tax=Terrisporobacter vanillatitrophus TaxID=3058402 RepID=UPI0033668EFC